MDSENKHNIRAVALGSLMCVIR